MLAADFRDRWANTNHFFVHIPKTGGTSLFDWFCQIYGADKCCQHIETFILPQPSPEMVAHLAQYRVLSGHVPIDYCAYFTEASFAPMTVIREPADQFFSHINHILTEDVGDGLLRGIRDKVEVSAGYFLDHASDEELGFFESSQSKPVFGATFDWRAAPVPSRLDWLRQTYTAVVTTEMMEEELGWMVPSGTLAKPSVARLNVKQYRRGLLTIRQKDILNDLLREDRALHHALMQVAVA